MKIAFLHPFQLLYRRGIERFVWELSKKFATNDEIEVHIITWGQVSPLSWGDLPKNIRILTVPYSRYYAKYFAIPFYAFWLLREKYDWVFLSFAGYGEAETITFIRKIYNQNYVVVFHYPLDQLPGRYKEFEKFALAKQANLLVGVSQYVADGVKAKFEVDCSVISNGVDPDIFKPSKETRQSVRAKLGLTNTTPVLVTLAALEMRKGIQYVIRALPYLIKKFPDLKYWVIGEGADRAILEQEVYGKGLEKHVQFFGQQDNVAAYLAAADVGCLLSSGEAFGISALEYMATELPIITSKFAPFPDFIKPSWGFMVDEQQSQMIAEVIHQLLNDDHRRQNMGSAARVEILKHYTWSSIAKQYLELLNSVSL